MYTHILIDLKARFQANYDLPIKIFNFLHFNILKILILLKILL